jgi:hypothetical protein
VLGRIVRVEAVVNVPDGAVDSATATCPAGYGIVGGGYRSVGLGVVFAQDSYGSPFSWAVLYDNQFGTGITAEVRATAYCAPRGQAVTTARARGNSREEVRELLERQRALHK